MNRRAFLRTSSALAAGGRYAFSETPAINKRDRMLRWLAGKTDPNYTPAAFFLHFGDPYKLGPAAAKKHLEFFRATDMDFVKIQFEQTYQRQPFLQKPSDWSTLKLQKLGFYEAQLQTVRDLVAASKKNALVLMTLYSPYMCAGHCASLPLLRGHLVENPDAVKRGMDILTESQLIFVRACIKAGVDGFYMSTQGSEAKHHSANPTIFNRYIKPFDLVAMKEASTSCAFNILHVCDYVAPYENFDSVRDYPGQVVNCNPKLSGRQMTFQEISALFNGRPVMGGLDRHGVLASGTETQVADEIRRVVRSAPRQLILGADCTVEANTDWSRLRFAIDTAHGVKS